MRSIKSVNLHIGYNKTGSSSIQAMLAGNRDTLASIGIYYPRSGEFNNAHYGLSAALIGHPTALPEGIPDIKELSCKLLDELDELSSPQDLIFSSEYLCCATPKQISYTRAWLDEAFPEAAIRIIVYLRRHDEWFTSLFNQNEKQFSGDYPLTYDPDINSYVIHALKANFPSPHYLLVLDSWATSFGIENIVVRPFQASKLKNSCVCDDFLSLYTSKVLKLDKPRINESLPEDSLLLTMLWNRIVGSRFPHNSLRLGGGTNASAERRHSLPDNLLSAVRLTNLQKENIARLFHDEYVQIAKKYLNDKENRLFD